MIKCDNHHDEHLEPKYLPNSFRHFQPYRGWFLEFWMPYRSPFTEPPVLPVKIAPQIIEGVEGWISTKTKFNEPLVLKSSGYPVEMETSGSFCSKNGIREVFWGILLKLYKLILEKSLKYVQITMVWGIYYI